MGFDHVQGFVLLVSGVYRSRAVSLYNTSRYVCVRASPGFAEMRLNASDHSLSSPLIKSLDIRSEGFETTSIISHKS